MRIPRYLVTCLACTVAMASSECGAAITFDDPHLKQAFNKALGRPAAYEPNVVDMMGVRVLAASNPEPACACGGTRDTEHFDGLIDKGLGGIECATAIDELYLEGHCRTAIDGVGDLTTLRRLSLRCNLLGSGDLASLRSLRALVALRLGYNEDITGIDSLLTSSLPSLQELRFESCNVSDISRVTTSTLPKLGLIAMQDNLLNVDAYKTYIPALVARLGDSRVLRDPPWCLEVTIDGDGVVRVDDHDSTNHTALNRPWYHPKAPEHQVRLVATAAAPYWRFDHWGDGASGTNPDTTITMSGDKEVRAYFTRVAYTLTVTSDGCSAVSGGGAYDVGSVVPISATVQPCYHFVNWTKTGDLVIANPNSPSTTVTVNGDGTVTAHCAPDSSTLTTAVNPAGGGSVARSPSKTTYECGEQVTLTATASPCYRFADWSGDASGTTNPLAVTADRSKSIAANFERIAYTLTTGVNPAGGGSVARSPSKTTYECGELVTLTATANPCYNFTGWSGDASGTANPLAITAERSKNITANFERIAYTLTTGVNPAGSGSVARSPDKTTYECGEQVALTANPGSCYTFTGWSGDASGTMNPITITTDRSKSFTANFTAKTYTLTVNTSGSCTVTRTPDKATYNCGEQVTLRAAAASCYRFTGWSGDASGTTNPITITMDAGKTVTANSAKITYTLTINAADGTVTRTPDKSSYDCGDTVELTATADACHEFTGWSGDASGTTNPLTVAMDRAKTIAAGFRKIGYSVHVCDPVGGSVEPLPGSYTHDCGAAVALAATPDAGYRFKQWAVSGGVSVDCATCPEIMARVDGDGTLCPTFEKTGGAVRRTIAILDVAEDSGTTKRAVCFYDVNDLRTADGRVFSRTPLFSVWTGYADSPAKQFEAPGAIAVNPINGTVYVLAMDAGTPGQPNAATGDFGGDYDLYRIDYQKILKDFIANHRPRGTMYAPRFGPDYDGTFGAQVNHPDHKGKTSFIDNAIEKIAELARNQGTSLFDYDLEFVNPARLVVLDNEKDSGVDAAEMDHGFRAFNRLSLDPAAGGAKQTWEANELGLVNLDFDATGKPAGRSEPIGIQYYLDPASGVAGLWVGESNGGGSALAFFEIANWTGPVGNRYRPCAIGPGPVFPVTFALDNDPILRPGAADGCLDWLRVTADGSLVLGESGHTDSPKVEPKVVTRHVVTYTDAKSRIALGPWAIAGPIHPRKDDDNAVTSGSFVAYDKGENLVYFFDTEDSFGPGAAVDAYAFDLQRGEMVYEELDAIDHSIKRHGIELFVRGDIDQDGRVDANDVAALLILVAANPDPVSGEMYDLTGDRRLDPADVSELVEGILGTTLADLNVTAPSLTQSP